MTTTPKPPATIQQDLFCSCGYNLLSQRVEVDERLSLPVCRCPECGRFHALATTCASPTADARLRGTAVIITVWLFLLCSLATATFMLVVLQFAQAGAYHETSRSYAYAYQWPWFDRFLYEYATPLMWLANAMAASLYGGLLAALFWHWRQRLIWWLLVIPPALCAMALVFGGSVDRIFGQAESQLMISTAMLAQLAGLAVGVRFGRACVRGLLRMFLSPRALQPLAVLWLVDGKPLPKPTVALEAPARSGPAS